MNSAPPASRARVLGVALAIFFATLATSARAEGPSAGGDEKEARRLFQEAELSFNVGKFSEALASYQAAYEAKPLPGFLFNIAQCYRNMGDYERARFFFRRYLTLDPRTPNRRRVEALIDEMSRQVQQQAAEAPAPAADAPGAVAEATASAPPAVEPPAAAAPPVVLPSAPVPAVEAPVAVASAPAPVWRRWWFWTAVGVVVVGAAVTAVVLAQPETRAPGTLDPIDGRP